MKPLIIATALVLTGCSAGMNTDFSCSGIDGIKGCVSLNDINTMVNNGQFATDSQGNVLHSPQAQPTPSQNGTTTDISTNFSDVNPPLMAGKPTRQREEVRQITIFPYIDGKGNYHDTSVIYTVIQSSRWIVAPFKPTPLVTPPPLKTMKERP
ncbi:type IV conjugative transfer system lipoprotein TraV [Photobacterium phosphoreum]|uniref:type IV conjugative transfer system lipoprotein TraV n=1 Tax=Photobacterium phosphoreum TaxID=659 RepID=UPI001E5C2F38|nr:type IV conjugative transfer system lipoprotein TraV [Photobacterium phosphoreum]MCD9477152.1 type IV conjugative transfer system lipoprotein TraV [Photobacterium phosphoreum]MCF2177971.1 type IV conjugative transfer system lipoprotein TraV [Photobacterium phosphoreum]